MGDFEVMYLPPSVEEYLQLRREAGLSSKSLEAATVGLGNSLFSVTIFDGSTLIGMGRIIGDGGAFFQIVDIAVNPGYQGRGLGKQVMKELMAYLDEHTYEGSYVSLIADEPANKLYEKFGFTYTYPGSFGMQRRY